MKVVGLGPVFLSWHTEAFYRTLFGASPTDPHPLGCPTRLCMAALGNSAVVWQMSVGGLGPPVSQLPRDEFVDHLVCLGGMPAELRDQRELLDHFLPPIRTDYM